MYGKRNNILGIALTAVFLMALFAVKSEGAQEKIVDMGFSEDVNYDIYFDYKLVQAAKILGTQEIQGQIFLVITKASLKSNSTNGLIRLSSISAILPTNYINARSISAHGSKFRE